jgi:hypothetical protein
MSLTDFILSFWKHKKILIFILFLSVIFSILLESFILKKSKIDIQLRNKDLINFQIYPSGMTTLSFFSEKSEKYSISHDYMVEVTFYEQFFDKIFRSYENLYNFSKLNGEKYDFYNYIKKNKTRVTKLEESTEKNFSYRIILPSDVKNYNFFKEYFFYSADISWESFKKYVLKIEQKKISSISHNIKKLETLLKKIENSDLEFKDSETFMKIYVKIDLLKTEKINVLQHIDHLTNLNIKSVFEDQIFDQPKIEILNQRYYNYGKFILPTIFSLIIYIIFILIRFVNTDNKN